MRLRNITGYGLFRILLLVHLGLPLLFLPFFGIGYLINPEAFTFDLSRVNFLSMHVSKDADGVFSFVLLAMFSILSAFITASIQAIVVRLLSKYTMIGNISLGMVSKTNT